MFYVPKPKTISSSLSEGQIEKQTKGKNVKFLHMDSLQEKYTANIFSGDWVLIFENIVVNGERHHFFHPL